MSELTEGWGWPGLAKKAHYFPVDCIYSYCNRWAYSGAREQGNDDSRDNCVACRRRLLRVRANEKK